MTPTDAAASPVDPASTARRHASPLREHLTDLVTQRSAQVGMLVLGALVLCALFADFLSPYDPRDPLTGPDEPGRRAQPCIHLLGCPEDQPETWLGTDSNSRDVWSRTIHGSRISLWVGFVTVGVAITIGGTIGAIAGFAGGKSDNSLMRIMDVVLAFPTLLLAIAIVTVLGTGLLNAQLAVAIVAIPIYARVMRSAVISVKEQDFVTASRALGESSRGILTRRVLPNSLTPMIVVGTLGVATAVLEVAALSFLGLGADARDPEWGNMIGREFNGIFSGEPLIVLAPSVALTLTVLAFNLIGDGLRDSFVQKAEPVSRPGGAQGSPILEVRGLQTSFFTRSGVVRAVTGVDLTVARGEVLGLVGESGCGKTVTSLSILGLIVKPGRIEAGEVIFDGRDLRTLPEREIRAIRGDRIAMIFQQPTSSLNPVMRVGDQVAEVLELHRGMKRGTARGRALELMRMVGIPDPERRINAYPHEMSGGMAQRVMIAMALACEPELLIADEPTTALDVTIQAQILDLMRTLQRETGTAIVLITHDLGVVAEMCDRVAVMYAGEIVEQTDVRTLFASPQHPYTRGLIASVPVPGVVRRDLAAISGNVPNMLSLPGGCRFAPRCEVREQAGNPLALENHPDLRATADGHLVRCWRFHAQDGSLRAAEGAWDAADLAEAGDGAAATAAGPGARA